MLLARVSAWCLHFFLFHFVNCHILKLNFLLEVCHLAQGRALIQAACWALLVSDFHTTYRRWN